jgi:hypothetical protein
MQAGMKVWWAPYRRRCRDRTLSLGKLLGNRSVTRGELAHVPTPEHFEQPGMNG